MPSTPGRPLIMSFNSRSVNLSWAPPLDNHNAGILYYIIRQRMGEDSSWESTRFVFLKKSYLVRVCLHMNLKETYVVSQYVSKDRLLKFCVKIHIRPLRSIISLQSVLFLSFPTIWLTILLTFYIGFYINRCLWIVPSLVFKPCNLYVNVFLVITLIFFFN